MRAIVLVAFASALIASSGVVAASPDTQKMTLTPAAVSVSVKPGEQKPGRLTVVNQGTGTFHVALTTVPYTATTESYDASYEPLPGAINPAQWVALKTTSAELSAGRTADIDYTLTIPSDTPPGGYQLIVFATSTPTTVAAGQIVTHNQIGQTLYVTVEGSARSGGGVVVKPMSWWSWDGRLSSQQSISNTGRTHFSAKTSMRIRSLSGREVEDVTLTRPVLPGTKRSIPLEWTASVPVGVYRVERTVEFLSGVQYRSSQWVVVVHPIFFAAGLCCMVGVVGMLIVRHHLKRKRI